MPSTQSFTGSNFQLESAARTAPATVRVRFTQDPLAVSAVGANDATNPANYSVSGPGVNAVVSAVAVFGDPQGVDVFLSAALAAGTWTISVKTNVQTTDGSTIQPPTSLSFVVSSLPAQEGVPHGAVGLSPADILRQHLNPALKGPAWDALIQAIATGDQTNLRNAELAFDQLFTSTASGIYLQRHAADSGLQRPQDIGMPDPLFRQYAIRTTNTKLVENALLDVLGVFYGDDNVRAHADSGPEPFAFADGDDLSVVLDEQLPVTTVFTAPDFAVPGTAKAVEVAAALTRSFRANMSKAYAVAVTDPQTNTVRVRVYSASRGLHSSVRVVGGKAQNTLLFPDPVPAFTALPALPTWTLTFFPASGTLRFSPTVEFDCSQVRVGHYVTVYGGGFNAANRGTFTVTNVYWSLFGGLTQYFEVSNSGGVSQAGLAQAAVPDLQVYNPTRKNLYASPVHAFVSVISVQHEVDVVLPATSQAVGRGPNQAAYGVANTGVAVTGAFRNAAGTVYATAPAHGFATGDQVQVDGLWVDPTPPTTTAGVYTNGGPMLSLGLSQQPPTGGTSDSSPASIVSKLFPCPVQGDHAVVEVLVDGRVLVAGGATLPVLAVNTGSQVFSVSSVATNPTTLARTVTSQYTATGALPAATYWFSGSSVVTGASTLLNKAVASGGFDGTAYYGTVSAFDPVANTWSATTSMAAARAGHTQTTLADATVLVAGGLNGGGPLAACERLTNTTWAAASSMGTARYLHQAVVLSDGRVLVAGGRNTGGLVSGNTAALASCEVFDPVGNTWTPTGSLTYARYYHRLVLLPDGRVLCVGGSGYDPTQGVNAAGLTQAEVWSPTTGRWLPAGSTSYRHDSCFAVYQASKKVVVVGGGVYSNVVEYLDLATFTWRTSPAKLPTLMSNPKAVAMANDIAYLATGSNPGPAVGPTLSLGLALQQGSTTDGSNALYVSGADTVASGSADGVFTATVVDANTFSYASPGSWTRFLAGGTATQLRALSSTQQSPVAYDLAKGLAVTASASTTSQTLSAGQSYTSVSVADATQFPDAPGWLVFGFGYANQVGPVAYLGRLSATALSLDAGYKFPSTVAAGAVVTQLAQKGPWVPSSPTTVGSFYLTASPAGRVAAQNSLAASVAAGIPLKISVTYPGDRGLGGEGLPQHGVPRVADVVAVFASDNVDVDVAAARVS